MSGSADCLLESRPGEDFSKLLRIIAADHEYGIKDLQGLVLNTEATLHQDFSDIGRLPQKNTLPVPALIEQTICDLREILKEYWLLLQKEKRHMRQFNALWNRVASIENICKELHNESLQRIMKPWLSAFCDCLKRCIDGLTEETQQQEDTQQKWEKTEAALESFITQVGGFLADLSRSDCFFMESERYNHPSVSSATSLLLGYNRWQKIGRAHV